MIGPLGRLGAAATLGQHCPRMTQRRCRQGLFEEFTFEVIVSKIGNVLCPLPRQFLLSACEYDTYMPACLFWRVGPKMTLGYDFPTFVDVDT